MVRSAPILLLGLALVITGCSAFRRPGELPPAGQNSKPLGPEATEPESTELDPEGIEPDLAGGTEAETRPHEDPAAPVSGAFLRGDRGYRKVALTFDDGPDVRFTPQVLDVLKRFGAPATFFLVGKRAEAFPKVTKRIVSEGHQVGNHSWDHALLTRAESDRVYFQIARTHQVLRRLTGQPVTVFRPPYGAVSPAVLDKARELGYKTALWNVDSRDWKRGATQSDIVDHVLPTVRNGSIILQHSAGGKGEDLTSTIQALPVIIKTLRGQGYRIVTLSELLATGKPRPGEW